MRIRVRVFVLGFVLVCLAAESGYGQQKSDANDTSLGDIARQIKAQKAKEHKPVRVITNDNLAGPNDEESGFGARAKGKSSADSAPHGSGAPAQAHDAEYFRSRLSSLQGTLDTHKRELEVLQQKLGQNQMQYYPDPNKSLLQQYSRDDINKFTTDIDAKKQQIADDEKAIEDLRDQLRHEGGDPSWLR
jgi:predicted RNase H-like nuclease (RuvC/YqgF family)